jgi:aryl-alcohol dehydrogenase-like predicted oxidoreductase
MATQSSPSGDDRLAMRRPLGNTGFMASVLGIGDVADRNLPLEQCAATIHRAVDAGLNVIDTAPNYEDGYSEQIVGHALRGIRDRLFVISKIDDLASSVAPQIEGSLTRLGMSQTDAFVFHNLSDLDLFHAMLRPAGSFAQLDDCARQGLTRFRGLSSHNPHVLHAALDAGVCDILMFPVGPFVDPRYVTEILPLARERSVATVCFKTFGAGKLLGDVSGYNQPLQLRPRGKLSSGGSDGAQTVLPRLSVEECVHYTLTLDPDVALLGLSFANEQDEAFAAARAFTPLSVERMADVARRAADARRGKGPCWWNPDPDA